MKVHMLAEVVVQLSLEGCVFFCTEINFFFFFLFLLLFSESGDIRGRKVACCRERLVELMCRVTCGFGA